MLDLGHNEFEEFPRHLYRLSNLWELNLAHNKISALPIEVTNMERLRRLDLTENPIEALGQSFKESIHSDLIVKL